MEYGTSTIIEFGVIRPKGDTNEIPVKARAARDDVVAQQGRDRKDPRRG